MEQVREAITEFSQCFEDDQKIAIPTQYLYPSNEFVTVYVAPTRGESFSVSDGGGALDTLSSHGIQLDEPEKKLASFCTDRALKARGGIIVTKPLPISALTTGIISVASASRDFARRELRTERSHRRRDLVAAVGHTLEGFYPSDRIKRSSVAVGASTRQYSFDFAVNLDGERRLLIDVVVPDPKSLNATAVANIDVGRAEDPLLDQRIVYDDEENWAAADLSLLQMAARTVPYSLLAKTIARYEAR